MHLTVRTKNLRDGLNQLTGQFWNIAEEKFTANDKKSRRKYQQALMKSLHKELQTPQIKQALLLLPSRTRKLFIRAAEARVRKLDFATEAKGFFERVWRASKGSYQGFGY